MRNTRQKSLILNIINGSTNHPSAQEIYEQALKVIPNISLGTVYRVLCDFVDERKIIKLKIDNIVRYDNLNYIHDHFHCNKCNTITDIYERPNLDYSKIGDYEVHECEIVYQGVCSRCLAKER